MLIIVDEATGVTRDIIDALLGNVTSKDAQIIMIYNPIDTTSFPFEAEETEQWHVITISAFEHPNVTEGWESLISRWATTSSVNLRDIVGRRGEPFCSD